MNTSNVEIKQQVLNELAVSNRLIGDVADDFGLPRRTVYSWLKAEQNSKSKKSKAIKVSKLKSKLAELSDELEQLQLV